MPSNIPLWTFGVAFRLRLVTFTEHAHRAHRPLAGIPAWRDIHQSHVAPARDIHRAGSQCPQTPQRQIALRGETNWTSPSKRLCPTPTWKGISRLDRQGNNRSGSNRPDKWGQAATCQRAISTRRPLPDDLPANNKPANDKQEGDPFSLPTIGRPLDYLVFTGPESYLCSS